MSQPSKSQRSKEIQQSNEDWIAALIWCIKAVGCLLWLAILFPALSIPAVVSLGMTLCYGVVAGMITAVTFVAGYGTWAALDARSFEAWIAQPVRQQFLIWWRYTRNWESVCALNGLTMRDRERDRTLTPRLRSVCIGKHTDAIDLRVSLVSRSTIGRNGYTSSLARGAQIDSLSAPPHPARCGLRSPATTFWPNLFRCHGGWPAPM